MFGILDAGFFLLGLLLLVMGADYLVDAASRIAKRVGVPDFTIGVTIVAIGTSLPELAAGVAASLEGEGGLVVGNAIGANMANICIIIGVVAILAPVAVDCKVVRRDGYIMLFVACALLAFVAIGGISVVGGLIFLSIYWAYLVFILGRGHGEAEGREYHDFIKFYIKFEYVAAVRDDIKARLSRAKDGTESGRQANPGNGKDLALVLVSALAIIAGAELLVNGAVGIADGLGITPGIIALTIISLGTTLPELTVALNATRKGLGDLAVGNILGSTIVNILVIVGLAAVITPIEFSSVTRLFTAPALVIASAILLSMMVTGRISRPMGVGLVAFYFVFMALVLAFFI